MAPRDRTNALLAAALLIVVTPAALAPIYSYDLFWHLAAGRWIAAHHALPLTDPFAIGSDRVPWINGEWLFEVPLFFVHAVGGIALVAWLRALIVATTFAAGFFFAARRGATGIALLLAALAFAGGNERLDARPGTVAALFVVLAIALLAQRSRAATIAYVLLSIAWINTHPSALLAPAFPAAVALLARERRDAWITAAASAAALLVNPFGVEAIAAPLRLTAFAGSGAFVNAEWVPSQPAVFPLLYVTVVIGVVAFASARDRRDHVWRIAIFAVLAYLSIAHVRNQGLYFAAFPLLVAPIVRIERAQRAFAIAALLPIASVAARGDHRPSLVAHRFPVAAVARLRQTKLQGNIYNPDQFGGYLIWSFFPQRRVLTDGRNELYHSFLREYAVARVDSRAWHALLRKYRIDLAVDEYRGALDVVDGRSGRHQSIPASLAYFPRRDWALIGYDDAGMVFARRAAFTPAIVDRWELRGIVPDAKRSR
jgi:hypothetical protein